MEYVAQGQTVSASLPALRIFTIFDNSTLQDAEVVEWRVLDSSGSQVFPTGGGPSYESVDVNAAKLATGTYAATGWTVDGTQAVGRYTAEWRYKELTADPDFIVLPRTFEVIGGALDVLGPAYASVAQLREEGITESDADDSRLHGLIVRASKQVERWTKRQFRPTHKSVRYNGSGGRKLLIDDPIVAIARAAITTITSSLSSPDETTIDRSLFFVYNRHLVSNLTSPDDRNNPKLEYFHGGDLLGHSRSDAIAGLTFDRLIWPRGPQLIRVEGVFGYTEYDGTVLGQTPELLAWAVALLVVRNLHKVTDLDKREDAMRRWRLVTERTRDQEYKLADLSTRGAANNRIAIGSLTGDPEIDNIIIMFMRPPAIRAV